MSNATRTRVQKCCFVATALLAILHAYSTTSSVARALSVVMAVLSVAAIYLWSKEP